MMSPPAIKEYTFISRHWEMLIWKLRKNRNLPDCQDLKVVTENN